MPGIIFTGLRILSIFIVLFGLINYLNTTITNFFTQKRERGMLQAVGTTKNQLAKMFFTEGLYYMVGMLACMLILGPVVLRLIIKAINNVSYVFTFPTLPVAGFTAMLLIIQLFLTLYTMRTMRKELLVESLTGNE
jgi:ABC-type antimicrobial peptide transport system permease subunit